MIENIHNSIMAGIVCGILGAICFFLFMCIRHHLYIEKKRWEMRLSLSGLEYTLKEIYKLLKKRLNYPNYIMMEFESENNRIRIICKNSIQLLSLEDGEIVLRGESQGKSSDELIDTECLMASITECFEMPVKEKGEILLKKRILDKWALRGLFIGIAVLMLKAGVIDQMSLSDKYIRAVKGSVLPKYDYGVNLGKSLHTWFAGEETWDTYENGDVRYVSVSGVCPYATSTVTGDGERQTFYFQIIDKDHFYFIGAYNMNGVPICTDTGNYYLNEYLDLLSDLPYVDTNLYEAALKAAFGDKESLNAFKRISNQL